MKKAPAAGHLGHEQKQTTKTLTCSNIWERFLSAQQKHAPTAGHLLHTTAYKSRWKRIHTSNTYKIHQTSETQTHILTDILTSTCRQAVINI